jgi:thymidylate synthase (FAD)
MDPYAQNAWSDANRETAEYVNKELLRGLLQKKEQELNPEDNVPELIDDHIIVPEVLRRQMPEIDGDGKGFMPASSCIEFIERMGDDARIVNAARVSYGKEIKEYLPLEERDKKLIRYLAKNKHESPFFHGMITLRIRMPIFVVREWYKHSVGFSRNEISRRYVDSPVWVFVHESLQGKDPKNKQGSKEENIKDNDECLKLMENTYQICIDAYRKLLEHGVSPGQARGVLPQAMMTEFIETASLMGYARLYKLRNSPLAMKEIRVYAIEIGKIMEVLFPVSWKELTSYVDSEKEEK